MSTTESHVDILIVGGGLGGCAAAMAAVSLNKRVILTEVTDWIGGQLTAQAVPPDESVWIEQFGCTRRYRQFRDGVRQYYRDHYPLTPAARANPMLNPGAGYVSQLCHEPRVALAVLEQMLAYGRAAGLLEVRLRYEPIRVESQGDWVQSVTFSQLETGNSEVITAEFVLDATELGDLLALGKVEYVTGAESQDDTDEPHAQPGPSRPDNVQSFTWCFPLAYDAGSHRVIDKPAQYERWRDYVPPVTPAWPGPLIDWVHPEPRNLEPRRRVLFLEETSDPFQSLWWYRRILTREHYPSNTLSHEMTLVNWPQHDYLEGNLIDQPSAAVATSLEGSRQLSFSLLYWLQTDAPRPDGGTGYPGVYLRPDAVGTADGLAKYPYIRESRRIRAEFTVTERHVGARVRPEGVAAQFTDSVGIGSYRIDLHPSTGGDNYIDIDSLPFQIPLGALLPVRVENVLPACKNLGVTHIANGCYRLHPVEWNIGEAVGMLTAFCLERQLLPRQVRADPTLLGDFQRLLRDQGVELEWPHIHAV